MRKLRSGQKDAIKYMQYGEHWALFMEMRLGKTLCCIRKVKQLGVAKKILVVGPYSALHGWKQELLTENQQCIVDMTGTAQKRKDIAKTINNTENVVNLWALTNKECHLSIGQQLLEIAWDVVILDESHSIKSPFKKKIVKDDKGNIIQSYYTPKISYFFVNNFRNVKHRIILSGTPWEDNELEFFNQLQFLDPGILRYRNYWDFRDDHFIQLGFEYIMKQTSKIWFTKKLAKHCFFLTRKDCNLGGEKIFETRAVDLPPSARVLYNRIEKEFISEVDGNVKSTIFATERFLWLRRICGGIYEGREIHLEKIKVMQELFESELKGQQVIIWTYFIDELVKVHSIFGDAVSVHGGIKPKERPEIVKQFTSGKVQYFIAQPGCFKEGVDLSCAKTMLYYSTPFGVTRRQTEDRFVNVGNKDSLLVVDITCKDTIEEDILAGIRENLTNQQILERMRKRWIISQNRK